MTHHNEEITLVDQDRESSHEPEDAHFAELSDDDLDEVAGKIKQRNEIIASLEAINAFRSTLLEVAREHVDTIMPGYTHGQHAQPLTLAHQLLAWVSVLVELGHGVIGGGAQISLAGTHRMARGQAVFGCASDALRRGVPFRVPAVHVPFRDAFGGGQALSDIRPAVGGVTQGPYELELQFGIGEDDRLPLFTIVIGLGLLLIAATA